MFRLEIIQQQHVDMISRRSLGECNAENFDSVGEKSRSRYFLVRPRPHVSRAHGRISSPIGLLEVNSRRTIDVGAPRRYQG